MTVLTLEQQVVKNTTTLVNRLVDVAVALNSISSASSPASTLIAYEDFRAKIRLLVNAIEPVALPSWDLLVSTLFIRKASFPASFTVKQLYAFLVSNQSLLGRLLSLTLTATGLLTASFSSFKGLPILAADASLAVQQMLSPVLVGDELYKKVIEEAKAQDIKDHPTPLPIFSQNKESYVVAGWIKESLTARDEAKKAEAKRVLEEAKKDPTTLGLTKINGDGTLATKHIETLEEEMKKALALAPVRAPILPPVELSADASAKVDDIANKEQVQSVIEKVVPVVNASSPYVEAVNKATEGAKNNSPVAKSVQPEIVEADRTKRKARIEEITNLPASTHEGTNASAKIDRVKAEEESKGTKKTDIPAPSPAPVPPDNAKKVADELDKKNKDKKVSSKDTGEGDKGRTPSADSIKPPVATLNEDFVPAADNAYSTGITVSFDNVQDLFKTTKEVKTQLMVEDLNDFRAVQVVKPFFTNSQALSFFRIVKNSDLAPVNFNNAGNIEADPSASDPFGSGRAIYNQFFIKQIQESYNEKFQLTDTLSTGQALFSFGSKPEIWSIQGQLINDNINNWLMKFREAWHSQLRIAKLVESSSYLRITIPETRLIINCYPVGLTINHSDETAILPSFGMQFFVKSVQSMPNQHLSIDDATTAYLNTTLSLLSQNKEDKNAKDVPDVQLQNSLGNPAQGVLDRQPTIPKI